MMEMTLFHGVPTVKNNPHPTKKTQILIGPFQSICRGIVNIFPRVFHASTQGGIRWSRIGPVSGFFNLRGNCGIL
jgi:hypothetical protein